MSATSGLGLKPQGLVCHLGQSLNMGHVFPLNMHFESASPFTVIFNYYWFTSDLLESVQRTHPIQPKSHLVMVDVLKSWNEKLEPESQACIFSTFCSIATVLWMEIKASCIVEQKKNIVVYLLSWDASVLTPVSGINPSLCSLSHTRALRHQHPIPRDPMWRTFSR